MGDMTATSTLNANLTTTAKPRQVMAQMREVADLLMEFVHQKKMSQKFGNTEHIMLPAWQFCGHFFGVTAKITMTEPYTDYISGASGFKAWADVLKNGVVVSAAESICLNDEDNWSYRPKYEYKDVPGMGRERVQAGNIRVPSFQLMSMAQTRAMVKGLSGVLRFIPVLAGFDSTPAEEMIDQTGRETERKSEQRAAKPQNSAPQQQSSGTGTGPITEGQIKRLHAIRKEAQCPQVLCGEIVMAHGFNVVANVTKEKYDGLISDIQNWQTWKQKRDAAQAGS